MRILLFCVTICGGILSCQNDIPVPINMGTSGFNHEWEFIRDVDTIIEDHFFQRESRLIWESVSLPHTPNIEPLVISDQQWQGNCFYRKFFVQPEGSEDKYTAVKFEGAMHEADIYLNGLHLDHHEGGYLPFVVDLTAYMNEGENCLLVRLSNEDNPQIPPGKPIATLDFNYFGGLYRGARLITKDKIRFSDPVGAGIIAGGGLMISTLSADSSIAEIRIDIGITNDSEKEARIKVVLDLRSMDGSLISRNRLEPGVFSPGRDTSAIHTMSLEQPRLWSPSDPFLYTMTATLYRNGKITDRISNRFGIRNIEFTADGFYLNGEKMWLRGTNRHQEYPYIGYALSENANYRDAYKIKEAGFNFVRSSHYPQAESFLDACDELGIMVMDAIAGWQFYGDSIFRENCKQDLRDLIRRDRNHPGIILWEASLNETWMTKEFIEDMHNITLEEMPYQEVYTCGWMDSIYDVFIPARQHGRPPDYWNRYNRNKPLLIAEYGDWEYYAQNAGFNQTQFNNLLKEERSSRQLRGYGQIRLSQQALNYQEAHNSNLQGSHAGDANWLVFDYNRGYAPDIESSGIMDIFRIPKFAYYFYRSQKDLDEGDTLLFIANHWNDSSFKDVKVFSNCDAVELYLNDRHIGRQLPDSDRYSTHLGHPPFTFLNVPYEEGTVEARGWVGGQPVVKSTIVTPSEPAGIRLSADLSGRELRSGSNDVVFVYATIVDEDGISVHEAKMPVHFSIMGEAKLVGENPVWSEAGIATILLRAGSKKSQLTIEARSEGLDEASLILTLR